MSYTQLLAINPDLSQQTCANLSSVNICLSNSAGIYTPTVIAGATVTPTNIYASTTVAPPGPVATGTTRNCGKYFMARPGNTCQSVSLNFTVDATLFKQMNPEINVSCTNLIAGEYYCVQPILGWNSTVTQIIPAPGPTVSGTTNTCYNWHIVVSGEYCALLENQYGITMTQLQQCNLGLANDCSNLALGDAYACILSLLHTIY